MSECNKKEVTCGNCQFAKSGALNWVFCEPIDAAIPHDFDGERYTFWRIPTYCPKSDSEVVKSEDRAPKKSWVFKSKSEIPKLGL
tara:strand:- start:2028 stop:2282 length:255 start_codon:yes stop_codon:yes gene_type:complete